MTDSEGTRPDDSVESRLRRALTTEAAMVQPAGDSLQKIRHGIDERRARAWWQHPTVVLVAAAVLGLAVSGVYFGVNRDDNGTTTTGATSPTQSAPTPTDPESGSASQSPSPGTTTSGDVYVYYLHDDGKSPRLYREQHEVTARGSDGRDVDKAQLAIGAMLGDEPADPDYASPWPDSVGVVGYSKDGDTATVDLSQFVSQGAEMEKAAVQQLVYTVTANDTSVKQVRLLVQGKAPEGHSDWSKPVARAPLVDVQGLVWLLSPTQDATVSSPVKIGGFGTAFEATISWEVRKDGEVVKDGVTQGGANGEFGEFADTVDLPAGSYEISAFESSAEDGTPVHIDTKSFTVK